MSRAFVKDPDGDEILDDLPERMVSHYPNYVTEGGLCKLQEELRMCESERASLIENKDKFSSKIRLAKVERDLRYFQKRIEQAIPVNPEDQECDHVRFGMNVEIRENKESLKFKIVGEDEALQRKDNISWVSPLAKSVLGSSEGDIVIWEKPGKRVELEIISFGYDHYS